MRFEKFSAPIERDIGGGVSLIVNEGRLNQSGLAEAKVELWNGKLLHSSIVLTAKEAERDKYRDRVLNKVKAAKVKGVKKAEIDAFLLDLDANLSTQLSAANTQAAATPVALTNFVAEITGDTIEDDDAETRCVFDIEAKLNGRTETFSIPASQFVAMRWPVEFLGTGAIIYPGSHDHARCAIQGQSQRKKKEHIALKDGKHSDKRRVGREVKTLEQMVQGRERRRAA